MYEAITHGVRVRVRPTFLQQHSDPDQQKFVWIYTIEISNQSDQTVQLLNRHWLIRDAVGHLEEVKGPGVIGKQPTLKPGENFTYSSFCHLKTDSGFMHGTFEMQYRQTPPSGDVGSEDATHKKGAFASSSEQPLFLIQVPAFSLDMPSQVATLN